MNKDKILNMCVIGTGEIFQQYHLDAILKTNNIIVTGIIDKNQDICRKVSKILDCKIYKDLDEIKNTDVCFIATPPHIRSQIIIPILEKGMDVICEKPFSYTFKESNEMIECANKNNKSIYVTQTRRLFSNMLLLRNLIENENINNINEIVAVEGGLYNWQSVGNERSKIITNDTGVLHDVGSHLIDSLFFILNIYDLDFKQVKVISSLSDFDLSANNFKCNFIIKLPRYHEIKIKLILSRDQNLQNYIKIVSDKRIIKTRSLFDDNIEFKLKNNKQIIAKSKYYPKNLNQVFEFMWKHIFNEIKNPNGKHDFSFNANTVLSPIKLIDILDLNKEVIEFDDFYKGRWNE